MGSAGFRRQIGREKKKKKLQFSGFQTQKTDFVFSSSTGFCTGFLKTGAKSGGKKIGGKFNSFRVKTGFKKSGGR